LSGSNDKSVCLWDIRSCQQIQVFNGHSSDVTCVEYSPFVINNSIGNSNVICSGSLDNTICFWDIRSNKNQLGVIEGDKKGDNGIYCLKFILLKKKDKANNNIKHFLFTFQAFESFQILPFIDKNLIAYFPNIINHNSLSYINNFTIITTT
ncbi:hypothetical protein RFI_01686, partial [Reticulomyxa filosa]